MPAPQVVAEKQPSRIRVTRLDSTHVVLSNPSVTGDTLVGERNGTRRAIPLSDVSSVALPGGSLGGSMGIFALLILAVPVVVLVAGGCCGN